MYKNLYLARIFTILFSFLSLQGFAAKITGTVLDAKDNSPIIGVVVIVKNTDKGAQTDVDGKFEINNIEDGTYEVLFSYIGYKKVLETVTVIKGKDVDLNIILKEEEKKTLKDVTVKATRNTHTENAVIMEMRKSNQIVSGISAQQIGKTMDRNAADVVKRVPGVTIMDDKFIMVRGLIDRYNTVWLNDMGAPSSEVDKKAFSFDVIPSGQIDRILVYKTAAPELPGDFAGGMVKIYTTSIPSTTSYSAGFQFSKREYSTGTPFNYNEPSKTDWLGYDDGKRSLPANLPNPEGIPEKNINKNDPNIQSISKSFNNDWAVKTKTTSPDMRFNFSAYNVFPVSKKVKIGNALAVNYTNTNTNYQIDRFEYSGDTTLGESYKDKTSVNNVSSAIMDNVAVGWGNNKIEFKNLYNQIGRSSLVDRYNTSPDSINMFNVTHDYGMAYESRAIYTTQLTGTHKSADDKRKYTWTLGYTDLFKNMPDLRRIRYVRSYADDDTMYATTIPSGSPDPVYGGGRVFSQLYEKTYVFNHQFSQKLRIKTFEFEVFAGNYIEYKGRAYALRQFGATLAASTPIAIKRQLTRLPVDQIFAEQNMGGTNQFKMEENTSDYDKYDAKNMLIASYLALKLNFFNDKLTVYGGVRNEYNTYTIHSYTNQVLMETKLPTNFILPSINVSYNITDKQLVRVAYGKTLNRPEFRENSPSYFYDMENRWGIYGAMFPTAFSDTLKVAQIHNVDARWEWYPSNSEMIQAGVFYKDIKDPIQQVILNPEGTNRSFTFANMERAVSYGLELDVRKSLSFVDDWFKTNVFSNLSLVGNAAFIKSEMRPIATILTDKSPMIGQSPYMYNAGLYYQNDSVGLQASVLYNVFGPRIAYLGQTKSNVGNIWELPFNSFDLIVSKKFFKYLTVSFGVQNLLDQKVRTAQDINADNKISTSFTDKANPDRLIMSYRPGRYYTIGVKVKI
ncbi:MAG: TonB-dependent receptor [Bacteroidetes bacterium]|nr:TonB-dependent receptor [Bacteroidota bacterium]